MAEMISIIGPTAGFLPDPLFSKNVDVLGGTHIGDADLFMDLINRNENWSPATEKYCIQKKSYPGFDDLIQILK
jgi:uncharacterized protein (DUF4213/DUF364 family)